MGVAIELTNDGALKPVGQTVLQLIIPDDAKIKSHSQSGLRMRLEPSALQLPTWDRWQRVLIPGPAQRFID